MYYMKFPVEMEQNEKLAKLSNNAKILYMYLFAKHELSARNGWRDINGTYIYFTRTDMAQKLNISLSTAKRVFAELKKAELVTVGERGIATTPRLYVKSLLSERAAKQAKTRNDIIERTYNDDDIEEAMIRQFMGDFDKK